MATRPSRSRPFKREATQGAGLMTPNMSMTTISSGDSVVSDIFPKEEGSNEVRFFNNHEDQSSYAPMRNGKPPIMIEDDAIDQDEGYATQVLDAEGEKKLRNRRSASRKYHLWKWVWLLSR